MDYRIEIKNGGRFFTVPCGVVDKYLKDADGENIKVLLCVLSYGDGEISDEKIADICGIENKKVKSALEYWNNLGVLIVEFPKDSFAQNTDFTGFEPIQIDKKQSVSESDIKKLNEKKRRETAKKYTASEISQIIDTDKSLRQFFDEAQNILGRIVTHNDQLNFIEIYEDCGYSPATILLIIEYCTEIGKTNSAYIKTTAKNWFLNDILTYEDIERHIIKLNEFHSYENKIKRTFGIEYKLTKKQQEYVNKWNSMGISVELCEYAYEKCVETTGKLVFKYIDTTLENYHKKDITTPQQAEEDDKSFNNTKNKPASKEHSYDINEIDEFQKNFLLKHLKKE